MTYERYSDEAFLRRMRRKVQRTMREHLQQDLNIVYTPPPNLGKTTGWINNIDELERDGTILQPNRELRTELAEEAEERGLDVLDISSFPMSDLHDDPEIQDWYNRGMPPREIEKRVDVPDDDPYFSVIQEDWDDYELLIGDAVHANLDRVVIDRDVAFDDTDIFDSFSTVVNLEDIKAEVEEYLREHSAPVTNLFDLLEADEDVRNRVLSIARNNDSVHDIPTTHAVTAQTNNYVRVLAGQSSHERRLEWEEYDPCITDGIKKIGYRIDDTITIVSIPMHLRESNTVNFLTATPNEPVIEQFYSELGLASDVVTCVNEQELQKYFEKYNIVQLTQSRHPLSSGWRANPERLETIVEDFQDKVGKTPDVVTTKKARLGPYEDLSVEGGGELEFHHYGEMIGVNKHGHKDAAVISGAPNFGDDYVKRAARFCNSTATVTDRQNFSDVEWGEDTAKKIFDHMTKDTILQAIMRFGRKVHDDVTIFVDTSHLPDWVPHWEPTVNDTVVDEPDSHMDVLNALDEESTVSEIYEKLDYSKRQIYRALESLADRGYVEVAEDAAKYGADVFERLKAGLAESSVEVDEALTLSDSTITMRRCQQMVKTEVMKAYDDRTLTEAMGLRQRLPDIGAREDMQLALGQFN